jgi:hypothetical protein
MASEDDRSVFVEPLPARPNLEMQQKRAKELLRAVWAGDAEALMRIRALHPNTPAPDALKLADAQLVVARGYGFESWAAMKRKIDSLTKTPVERFLIALHDGDAERVREFLEAHAEVRAVIVERCLREDPEALDHRTWHGKYTVVHKGTRGGRTSRSGRPADRSRRCGRRTAGTSHRVAARVWHETLDGRRGAASVDWS